MGERTGSRVLQWVWSYVLVFVAESDHIAGGTARLLISILPRLLVSASARPKRAVGCSCHC
ncbi:hypothetical protein CCHR01_19184 [Colletotrichum chrysophilum]|uniref:Secreted protein n=1 Tax=Colletotrichum chrysophilum TaxID=1836956 RepID=A0AAD8ZZE4_9PEZI|nr:hypothetical protein CCHR01_19184 [Colletotrichum chrysophilum]